MQKRCCPHGTSATRALHGSTRHTSQHSPASAASVRGSNGVTRLRRKALYSQHRCRRLRIPTGCLHSADYPIPPQKLQSCVSAAVKALCADFYTPVVDEIDALFGAPDGHPAAHSINVCLAVYHCLLKMSKKCEQVRMRNFDPTTRRCMKTFESISGCPTTVLYGQS